MTATRLWFPGHVVRLIRMAALSTVPMLMAAATALMILAWGVGSTSMAAESKESEPAEQFVYIGSTTDDEGPPSEGLYVYRMNSRTGEMRLVSSGHGGLKSPSFLAFHPNGKFLYAAGYTPEFTGDTGAVAAYAIDGKTGAAKLLNAQSSEGAVPCHLVVDATGKAVLVANYSGGSVASLPIGPDGRLGKAASAIRHGGVPVGQPSIAKAHSINLDPTNRFAVAADLGLDQVIVYRFDPMAARLTPHNPPFATVAKGSGPRHAFFHPSSRYLYVINEANCTATAFAFDAPSGRLTEIQTISTIPVPFQDGYSTAEILVHPSGRYVYGSNRGHDTIAIFSVDESTGKLAVVGHESTQGKTPRNFGIDSTGRFLLAGNQESNTVVQFRIDMQTGRLTPTGLVLEVPAPLCIRFLPVDQ